MSDMPVPPQLSKTDPRHLRAMFDRAAALAQDHGVTSVFVGVVGAEGDPLVRDFLDFVEAELRVEDAIYRILRERAVLLLTDVPRDGAVAVLERLKSDFSARFGTVREVEVHLAFVETKKGTPPTAKDVLPLLFDPRNEA
jgi:hypothetical protein